MLIDKERRSGKNGEWGIRGNKSNKFGLGPAEFAVYTTKLKGCLQNKSYQTAAAL